MQSNQDYNCMCLEYSALCVGIVRVCISQIQMV